jgi:hypothetical protein
MSKLYDELAQLSPCKSAYNWMVDSGIKTWQEAWYKCPRGDWTIWLLMKIRIPKPYGRYAVIALEQGLDNPDAFSLYNTRGYGFYDPIDSLRDCMDSPDCNWLASNTVRIDEAARDYAYHHNTSTNLILKQCADRVRAVVPFKVVMAALNELRTKDFCYY